MKISEHFSYYELIVTSTGLPNDPPNSLLPEAIYTAQQMEAVRAVLGNKSIRVNSWYRSPAVNKAVGGSSKSQHTKCEAVDFICPGYGTPYQVCQKLAQHKEKLKIDQLIYEGTWVHISFVSPPRVPRLEVLTYMLDKSYQSGLHLKRGGK